MKLSDTLLQQDGLSMAHDGATYCGTPLVMQPTVSPTAWEISQQFS